MSGGAPAMAAIDLGTAVAAAAANPEFVENWARLRGIRLPATPMDKMIDEATGHGAAIARQFIADVDELVCQRLEEHRG